MNEQHQTENEEENLKKQDIKLKKIALDTYEIPQEKNMLVPGKIFASESLIEKIKQDTTLQQVKNVAVLPGIYKYSLAMSDAHQGYGFPVGGVAAFDVEHGCISPGGIGFDVNCGVRVLTSSLNKEQVYEKIQELLEALFKHIPCGVGGESQVRLTHEELDRVLELGIDWAVEKGYATPHDKLHSEEQGRMKTANAKMVSPRAKKRGKNQLGTLGAGNHFVEVQYVNEIYDEKIAKAFGITKKDQVVVMIHSGSRGLGHQVCSDYLREIEETYPDLVKALPDRDLAYAPAQSQLAQDYLQAMSAAANFGWVNRQLISYSTRKAFEEIFGKNTELQLVYDVAHNIAKVEEYNIEGKKRKVYVHRKGATRAFGPGHKELPEDYQAIGQPILLPGSMGTASYILVGTDKAMNETFSSTPHGAGRVMSRKKAKDSFRGEKIKQELEAKKIYIKAASYKGICEEAPQVYKDVDEVVRVADEVGIGKKVVRLVPMGVIKG
ncbi:RtcB family protein [Candidatus Woesearchaeota archaeon]|nr:RtcB family protein [Candidatus Woesearchaeota archaeon]